MSLLNEIKAPVEDHIREFEKKFRDSMRSKVPLLDRITAYLVKRKGKQIRPLFVFLTAKTHGQVNDSTYRAASLIELLHTATLIHDDVVDDSNERRGFFSLNALWKNKISVLIGDFLLSKGLLLSLDNNDFDLLRIVADATREMSEGELLQIEKARRLDISEDIYFEIIRKKTASLIASCCACGAASAGADQETIKKYHRFGELTGIAFQIKDDLFDYSKSMDTGKPNGIDIKEKKMTLPLIFLLTNASWLDKRRIINIVKNHNDNPAKVNALIKEVYEKGGIAYAEKKMFEYRDAALELLSEFPDNISRSSLEKLVIFTTERKY
ncbi:MAG: polyprenyl synthetase [Bacteroidetes bacterium HGW-Bacteroidetes-11]|jgi:octaprenyl-diphosphate synthase|nr:MAG: polyprenyl synthetase [Bacteroidetes bacterium HGW-Bacteroidetes-11]